MDSVFHTLKSSAMDRAAYNKQRNELTIHFKDGDLRTYKNVPQKVAEEFFAAGSHGVYFNYNIRDKYEHN